jgi:hypothetical protein
MSSSEQYRARAKECIEAADRLKHPENRLALLELARRWMHLAFKVKTVKDGTGLNGDALLDPPGTEHMRH